MTDGAGIYKPLETNHQWKPLRGIIIASLRQGPRSAREVESNLHLENQEVVHCAHLLIARKYEIASSPPSADRRNDRRVWSLRSPCVNPSMHAPLRSRHCEPLVDEAISTSQFKIQRTSPNYIDHGI